MRRYKFLISTRYIILMGHLLLLIAGMMTRESNVKSCLPAYYTDEQYRAKDVEVITALALSVVFVIFELTSFGSGLTMFNNVATVSSIITHTIGSIFLTNFLTESWDCITYWYMFAFTIVLPLVIDVVVILMDACSSDAKYK